jgi:dGTPase
MRKFGGFEHNLQSLRVVDELEDRYADFHGLNLTFECREGILKHCSVRNARQLGELGERFIRRRQPSLEAQLSNLADEIAYNNHDVADGLRAGLITLDDLSEVDLFARQHRNVLKQYTDLPARKVIHETIRRVINQVVSDLIRTTRENLDKVAPTSAAEVRARSKPLVGFSPDVAREQLELKQFLNQRVYRHYKVLRMTSKARLVVTRLFDTFVNDATLMPTEHHESVARLEASLGTPGRARAVADYIAGMTDRYAILEHRRLFDPAERT